ncbi:60S ribosomal protein L27, partial [Lemmus lemmus]
VTAAIGKKKIARLSKIKSFVKVYSSNHPVSTVLSSVAIPLDTTAVNKDVLQQGHIFI